MASKFNKDYDLLAIVEKPDPNNIQNYTDALKKVRVSMNIFLFDGKHFFKYLENSLVFRSKMFKQ